MPVEGRESGERRGQDEPFRRAYASSRTNVEEEDRGAEERECQRGRRRRAPGVKVSLVRTRS